MRKNQTTCVLALSLICSSAAFAQESVMGRLATAKILESKGDVLGAEKELRSALQAAPEGEQPAVAAQLVRLLGNQGRTIDAAGTKENVAPQNPLEDPVDRLIGVLNTGDQTPEVKSAIRQLGKLGDLVVPHLLRAFPKLGPFGVMNSLQVLRYSTDARIAPFLVKQIETASPEIQMAIVNGLHSLPKSSGLPVALKIGQGDFSEKQKLVAFSTLLKHAPESTTCRALAGQLLASDVVDTRLSATLTSLYAEDLTEAAAIKALRSLPKRLWPQVAQAADNSKWVTFGVIVFDEAIKGGTDWQFTILRQYDWTRSPDEAAPLLLQCKNDSHNGVHPAVRAMSSLVRKGWKLPAKLDDQYVRLLKRFGMVSSDCSQFVESLPGDDEERALGLWQRHPILRYSLVDDAQENGYDWHRLTTRHLLSLDNTRYVPKTWFQLDWSKAPAEAIDDLVAFAEKWPNKITNQNNEWAAGLAEAYEKNESVPIGVVRPLFLSGDWTVWQKVNSKDPEKLLELAAAAKQWAENGTELVANALAHYGTRDHMPLALRVLREPCESSVLGSLSSYFEGHAAGSAELVLASTFPSHFGSHSKYVRQQAEKAAQSASVRDLPRYLQAMPAMPTTVVNALRNSLERQVGSGDVDALGQALRTCLQRPPGTTFHRDSSMPVGSTNLCRALAGLLAATKDERAVPHLQTVFLRKDVDDDLLGSAARACLEAAGDNSAQVVRVMLQSEQSKVVVAALASPVIGTDQGVRDLAMAAVMRLAKTSADTGTIFGELQKADAEALAKRILDHEDMAEFDADLVRYAVDALNGHKDARYIPLLKKAVLHPDGRVRREAAEVLGNTFVREAADPLLELLKDDYDDVRAAAQKSLNQIANYLDERAKWEKRFGK